jgi:hypothetical protein
MRIKRWLRAGEVLEDDEIFHTETLLEIAGRRLDKAYAHEIMGEILFEGEDGKTYVGCVEFCINEANPEYVKTVMEEE